MADSLSLNWHGVDDFKSAIEQMNRRVEMANQEALPKAGRELVRLAAVEAPHKSGELARSIEAGGVTGPLSNSSVKIGPTAIYGRRVDLGFKPKYTKKGNARSFRGSAAVRRTLRGQGVSRSVIDRVIAEGNRGLQATRPNPFLERANAQFAEQFRGITLAQWAKAIEK